jgi:predicted PurR-regulated permease PerM
MEQVPHDAGVLLDPNSDDGPSVTPVIAWPRVVVVSIVGMFVMTMLSAVYVASSVLIPITLAVLLSTLLAPAAHALERFHLPRPLAAGLVVLAVFVGLSGTLYALAEPAQSWLEKFPESRSKIERHFRTIMGPLTNIKKAADELERSTDTAGPAAPQKVQIQRPGLIELFLGGTTRAIALIAMVVILAYLLVASGDSFLRKLVSTIPTLKDKKRAVDIVRSIEADISSYLALITFVNVTLGIAVAITTAAVGLPNPLLWGVLTIVLSFAPYIGEAMIAVILAAVGMLTFDRLADAAVAPAVYLVIMTATHAIVPILLSRRLSLNPVAIFVAIILWGWMWGIPGALLAVPLLASFKIICERFEPLQPIAEFLAP